MKTLQKTMTVLAVTMWLAPLALANPMPTNVSQQMRNGGFDAGGGKPAPVPTPTPTPRPKPVGPRKSGDE